MRSLQASLITLLLILAPLASANAQQRPYPSEVVDQYVNDCSAGQKGQVRVVCKCIITGIQRQYTYPQFQRLNDEIARAGRIQNDGLNRIIQTCKSNPSSYSLRSLRVKR